MNINNSETARRITCGGIVAMLLLADVHGRAQERGWQELVIAAEERCSAYRVTDYSYPQTLEPRIIAILGGIYGPYTGRWFQHRRETDIEHIVARSEAHDSGLCAAPVATRASFARDLLNLTLAAPRVNRVEKGARDAAEWLPAENSCWFAARVVRVRQKYNLTIDWREATTLNEVLSTCRSTRLVVRPRPLGR